MVKPHVRMTEVPVGPGERSREGAKASEVSVGRY